MLNVVRAWEDFQAGSRISRAKPFKSIIELTRNCNFRCLMCPQSWWPEFEKYRPELNMSPEVFLRVAAELFPWATFVDLRGFGETTILPYWPEVVDELQKHPFVEWHLVTNLSLPRPETWRKMIRTGFTLGFSCDGATQATFETIRRRSRFATILENLEILQEAIAQERRGYVYFISTIQRRNFHEMAALVELAARFGVTEVQFKWVHPRDHHEGIEDLAAETLNPQVRRSIDAALAAGVRVTFNDWRFLRGIDPALAAEASRERSRLRPYTLPEVPPGEEKLWNELGLSQLFDRLHEATRVSEKRRCFKPFHFAYVDYSGKLGTCNHMMHPDAKIMGDLATQSFEEIWNGSPYREFRGELLEARPEDPRCRWCFEHRLED
jgi:radical SAM protein with 4Fe4S-binding SPASM domain